MRVLKLSGLRRLIFCLSLGWYLLGLVSLGGPSLTGSPQPLVIQYPLSETIFPPGIVPPTVRWSDPSAADSWEVSVSVGSDRKPAPARLNVPKWTPGDSEWKSIQELSARTGAVLTITGFMRARPTAVLSQGAVRFRTSKDAVDAPIFYREVILPFIEAVKEPALIRWRLGWVTNRESRVVLQGVPACGNCHSFPKDASVLAMDVDYANSKGSYVIAPVARRMALRPQDVITWEDYRRGEGAQTFGFLSQISPDGRVVVSTVKDRSVFVPKPDLAFSQLFFPIKGILVLYDRDRRQFRELPGADDPAYVQSNASWSPDGRELVFARAKAHELRISPTAGRTLLSPEECEEFLKEGKPFRFDLYRLPYNEGRGGIPQPLAGASGDGFSHFFARYSPDGNWIVFCRARNYMLLQPDSELFIVPAAGGTARRLGCNTARMNSWHSWSPNSRWLVFSSKANGPYTQLFLTHIDEQGESSPPVELPHLTAPDRAANIPEFVSLAPGSLERIDPEYLNDYSYARTGFNCEQTGDVDRAIQQYTQALRLNPQNVHAHERLGYLLCNRKGKFAEGLPHCREAVRLQPDYGQAHYVLGCAFYAQGQIGLAIPELIASLKGVSQATDPGFTPVAVHSLLGAAFLMRGQDAACVEHFREALRLDAGLADCRFYMAVALARQGHTEEAVQEQSAACQLKPELDQMPIFHNLISLNLAKTGRFPEAAAAARKALNGAQKAGNIELARELEKRIADYEESR